MIEEQYRTQITIRHDLSILSSFLSLLITYLRKISGFNTPDPSKVFAHEIKMMKTYYRDDVKLRQFMSIKNDFIKLIQDEANDISIAKEFLSKYAYKVLKR